MYLDLIILIPIAWGMFRGFKRGLIIELCTLMALVLGIFGASEFGDMGSDYIQTTFNTEPRMSLVLAFTILFIIIVVAVFFFGKILTQVIKMAALGLVNRLVGMLFGGTKFLLLVSALMFVINGFSITESLIPTDWKKDSILYQPVQDVALSIYPVLDNQTWVDDIHNQIKNIKESVIED